MISIIIPTYNRATILRKILDCVIAQTFQDWECLIVDDHSTDNTENVVSFYTKQNARFVYVKNNRTKGSQGARNTGILTAKGEWICLFDSDDVMYPNYLEKMMAAINDNTDVVICKALICNNIGKECGRLDRIYSDNYHADLLRERCYVAYDVTLIRKKKLLEIGLLDESCPSMQEWDTHLRLSKVAKYKPIDNVLCEWTIGGEDAISTSNIKHIAGLLYIYRKHAYEFRKYAYCHYLHALSELWKSIDYSWKLLLLAPELIIYVPLRKLFNK